MKPGLHLALATENKARTVAVSLARTCWMSNTWRREHSPHEFKGTYNASNCTPPPLLVTLAEDHIYVHVGWNQSPNWSLTSEVWKACNKEARQSSHRIRSADEATPVDHAEIAWQIAEHTTLRDPIPAPLLENLLQPRLNQFRLPPPSLLDSYCLKYFDHLVPSSRHEDMTQFSAQDAKCSSRPGHCGQTSVELGCLHDDNPRSE